MPNGGKYRGAIPQARPANIPGVGDQPKKTNDRKVVFSFELFDASAECPSTWIKDEVKALLAAFRKASERTWQQVIDTGGKAGGGKVGLGFTAFKTDPIPRPALLSSDLAISEMRVSDVARVFGSRKDECFFVIRLDRAHAVCPEK